MITLLAALITLAATLVFQRTVISSWLNPAVVFGALWTVLLLALCGSGDTFFPLSGATATLYTAGPLCIMLGAVLYKKLLRRPPRGVEHRLAPRESGDRANPRILLFLVVISAVLLPAYFAYLNNARLQSTISDYWIGLRATTGTEDTTSPFGYLSWGTHIVSIIAFREALRKRVPWWQCLITIAVAMVYTLSSASRLGALRLIFGLAGVAAVSARRIKPATLVATALGILMVFVPSSILLRKGGDRRLAFHENVFGIARSFQNYTLGGLVAFDRARTGEVSRHEEYRSLRFFYAVVKKLGRDVPVPQMVLPVTGTPTMTNVYTIYYTYFFDFGWCGTFAAMIIIGMAATALYYRAVSGSSVALVLYGILLPCLLLSNADEYFLTGFSANVQAIAITTVLYKTGFLSQAGAVRTGLAYGVAGAPRALRQRGQVAVRRSCGNSEIVA